MSIESSIVAIGTSGSHNSLEITLPDLWAYSLPHLRKNGRNARGHGRQKGDTEFYRGREYSVDLLPKARIDVVVPDELAENVIRAIISAARTGKIGDGKIFISKIDLVAAFETMNAARVHFRPSLGGRDSAARMLHLFVIH